MPADPLAAFAARFEPPAEVIAEGPLAGAASHPVGAVSDAEILALLRRRPCTAQGVAEGLGMHLADAVKRLDALSRDGMVTSLRREDCVFYRIAESARPADLLPHVPPEGSGHVPQ